MTERRDPRTLRREPREGSRPDATDAQSEKGVAAPRLRGTFREALESDEDA